jgi:hypothetical protein
MLGGIADWAEADRKEVSDEPVALVWSAVLDTVLWPEFILSTVVGIDVA